MANGSLPPKDRDYKHPSRKDKELPSKAVTEDAKKEGQEAAEAKTPAGTEEG